MNNGGPTKPKSSSWPGVAFLMCLMVCVTAIVVAWIIYL